VAEEEKSVELFRQEGAAFRSVRARLEAEKFVIDTQDMGELVEQMFGDSDYEFWTIVSKEAWGDLLYALAQEFLGGDAEATDRLKEICDKYGVKYERGYWA